MTDRETTAGSEGTLERILEDAMNAERTGYAFYRVAAEQSEDPGAKQAFAVLAEDERDHHRTLQQRYRDLIESGHTEWPSERHDRAAEPVEGSIFSPAFRERIRGRHFEMSALAIGVLLEKRSIDFYRRQAEAAPDPRMRAFFDELVTWETEHYERLLRQQQTLRDEDWEANRFEPLL
jgi:rubrerythrin